MAVRLLRNELANDVRALGRRIKNGTGVVSAERRRAAASGVSQEGALGEYLGRVHDAAAEITDEEVAALRAAGHSDEELFELTVAAALGASEERLEAGLAAVQGAYEGD